MDNFTYLNFDLLIQRAGAGYRAQVIDSPAGQATVEFEIPFSEERLENYLLKIGRPRRGGTRSRNSPEVEAAKNFGDGLFKVIFKDEVRGCLRSSIDQARDQGAAGLRLRLRLGEVPELADLPWEFLYNKPLNKFLALSSQTPLVRFLELPERIDPLTVKPPLRVLVMISSPTDYQPLDVEQEWSNLRKALAKSERLGLVRLERIDRATPGALHRHLRRGPYHVFHFIGHGGFDKHSQDGVLIFENSEKRGLPMRGEVLAQALGDHRPMRLAVLNACEGARGAVSDPFAGVAQNLVQQGLPAVIAMQFEITDQAAILFAREFYQAIADNFPVDMALTWARKGIFGQGNCLEWGTPVLYLRSPHGQVFDVERMGDEERKQLQQIASLYADARLAASKEAWEIAIRNLQAILKLDPSQSDVAARLEQVEEAQYVASLYDEGLRHQQAGRRDEALRCFLKIQEIRSAYKDMNRLVAHIEEQLALEARLAALRRAARAALDRHDWNAAVIELEGLISLEPSDEGAKSELTRARQQQELLRLYEEGRKSFAAERWVEAAGIFVLIRERAGEYKDVGSLLAAAERKLMEARRQEERGAQLTALHEEAARAREQGDWAALDSISRRILSAAPDDERALRHVRLAEEQSEIMKTYAAGLRHYEQGQWSSALACFQQVREAAGDYKDAADLIAQTRLKMRAEELARLDREAEAAVRAEDWALAEEKLRRLSQVDDFREAALSRLEFIRQERERGALYEEARRLSAAGRPEEALKTLASIEQSRADYKDVPALVREIKAGLEKKEARRAYGRALAATGRDDWGAAVEELRAALRLDAGNREYAAKLKDFEQQQLLSRLYAEGLSHYQARHWAEAHKCFARIIEIRPAYKDTAMLFTEVQSVAGEIEAADLLKCCPRCGAEYPVNENFCDIDGARLEEKRKQLPSVIIRRLKHLIKKYR